MAGPAPLRPVTGRRAYCSQSTSREPISPHAQRSEMPPATSISIISSSPPPSCSRPPQSPLQRQGHAAMIVAGGRRHRAVLAPGVVFTRDARRTAWQVICFPAPSDTAAAARRRTCVALARRAAVPCMLHLHLSRSRPSSYEAVALPFDCHSTLFPPHTVLTAQYTFVEQHTHPPGSRETSIRNNLESSCGKTTSARLRGRPWPARDTPYTHIAYRHLDPYLPTLA